MPVGHQSTPGKIMNGHFAASHGAATKEQYERGIQVIDEDKEFRYVGMGSQLQPGCFSIATGRMRADRVLAVTSYPHTSNTRR